MTRIFAATAALLALGACGSKGESGTPAERLGFDRHADAVLFPASSDWVPGGTGLRQLVPLQGCVLGIGSYANGFRTVGANWAGADDCTRLVLSPSPGAENGAQRDLPQSKGSGWSGGGLSGNSAVVMDDGSLIAVGSRFLRRDPAGEVHQLAEFTLPPRAENSEGTGSPAVRALTRVGGRLLAAGTGVVDGRAAAVVWESDDAGATVRQIPLPTAPGLPADDYPWIMTSDGDSVLATSFSAGRVIRTWVSADGGRTWTASATPSTEDQWIVHSLVRQGGEWLILGTVTNPKGPDTPLVLSSTDGVRWTRGDTSTMGAGGIVASTRDHEGGLVLVGQIDQVTGDPNTRPEYCGVVWVRKDLGWDRGELGCDESPPTAAITLADGRVLIAGNRHLWIRNVGPAH